MNYIEGNDLIIDCSHRIVVSEDKDEIKFVIASDDPVSLVWHIDSQSVVSLAECLDNKEPFFNYRQWKRYVLNCNAIWSEWSVLLFFELERRTQYQKIQMPLSDVQALVQYLFRFLNQRDIYHQGE